MIEIWLIIPAVIIFILFLPVILELRVTFNPITNTGVISFYLYKFNVLHYIFEFKGETLSLKNNEEEIEKKIEFNSLEFEFYKSLVIEIKDKLRLRFLEFFYNVGLGDAFYTSMLCGYINIIVLIIFSYIKNIKPTARLGLYDTVSYNEFQLVGVGNVNLSISLFDFVYSLLLSVILTMKKKQKNNM